MNFLKKHQNTNCNFDVYLIDSNGGASYPQKTEFILFSDMTIRNVNNITWTGLNGFPKSCVLVRNKKPIAATYISNPIYFHFDDDVTIKSESIIFQLHFCIDTLHNLLSKTKQIACFP